MIEAEIELETEDGTMNVFSTRPEDEGPFPLVFFYMDAPGKREELHDMARRIATTGYWILLPNLYYRTTKDFELDFASGESQKRMFELLASLSNQDIVRDTRALIDYAEAQPSADASRIGCVGYCMSGPFSLSVAAAYPERIRAAASVYGVALATDAEDSPHQGFPKVTGEIYVAAAETDSYAPPEMIQAVEDALEASGTRGAVEIYPGTHHGFAFPNRGEIYDKAAAERHWERLHSLFDRNLRSTAEH